MAIFYVSIYLMVLMLFISCNFFLRGRENNQIVGVFFHSEQVFIFVVSFLRILYIDLKMNTKIKLTLLMKNTIQFMQDETLLCKTCRLEYLYIYQKFKYLFLRRVVATMLVTYT